MASLVIIMITIITIQVSKYAMFFSLPQVPRMLASRFQRWQPVGNKGAGAMITRLVNPFMYSRPALTQTPSVLMAIRTASSAADRRSNRRSGRKISASKRKKSGFVLWLNITMSALTASRRTPRRQGQPSVPSKILRALRKLKHNRLRRDAIIKYLKESR